MGCDCCKIQEPDVYEKCQALRNTGRKVPSPCGGVVLNDTQYGGSNYTPPKKRNRKKVKHRR